MSSSITNEVLLRLIFYSYVFNYFEGLLILHVVRKDYLLHRGYFPLVGFRLLRPQCLPKFYVPDM